MHNWSWIDNNGQEMVEVFADEVEAGKFVEAVAQAMRQRGYQDL